MVLEDFKPLSDWFWIFFWQSFGAVLVISVLGVLISFLRLALRSGPSEAFYGVASAIGQGAEDLVLISPRRVWAMTRLAFKEAIRRKVLYAFAVFVVLILFGGWFLDTRSDHPARLYLAFVLNSSTYLVLLLGLFLSSLSLPTDIKNHTIYTVVTKPVRASEIVLGRILGFGLIGSVILLMLGVSSYLFAIRGVSHAHEVRIEDLADAAARRAEGRSPVELGESRTGKQNTFTDLEDPEKRAGHTDKQVVKEGFTTMDAKHRHRVFIYSDGSAAVADEADHTHSVDVVLHDHDSPDGLAKKGDVKSLTLGPPEGLFQARVPVYGKLSFRDREGNPAAAGISVGEEWAYRTYIEGGTRAEAIYTFDNIRSSNFPDSLMVEANIQVFRTYKADIERPVSGMVWLQKPGSDLRSVSFMFLPREFAVEQIVFPRKITVINPQGKPEERDLFEDLVDSDGRIELHIKCTPRAQYYGMAQHDVYLHAADRPFAFNFFKAFFAIWMQMVIVISFGVMFSTLLSGPVAMFATLFQLLLGYKRKFITSLVLGVFQVGGANALEGGGPIESFIRDYTQQNMTSQLDLDPTLVYVIQVCDRVLTAPIAALTWVLPDYSELGSANFVADGFDIPRDVVWEQALTGLFFLVVLTALGYFLFRSREIAA